MKDLGKVLSLYESNDLVCLLALPSSKKLTQRFMQVRNLRAGGWIKFLCSLNYKGANIYLSVNPLKEEQRNEHSVVEGIDKIFFDFDSESAFKTFQSEFRPTVLINTSYKKYQVFLRLTHAIPKADAKKITKAMAKEFGADISATDLARLFRAPGFLNWKYSSRPIAKVIEFNPRRVYDPHILPKDSDVGESFTEPNTEPKMVMPILEYQQDALMHDYEYFMRKTPLKADKTVDLSRADIAYGIYLLSCGLNASEVKEKIRQESFNIVGRKGNSIDKYLERTIMASEWWVLTHFKKRRG